MEQARGISITSAAPQFSYGDCVINLLDTPGHADFSEATALVRLVFAGVRSSERRAGLPLLGDRPSADSAGSGS